MTPGRHNVHHDVGFASGPLQGSKYRVPHLRPAGTLFSTQVALYLYLHFAQVSAAVYIQFERNLRELLVRACVRA